MPNPCAASARKALALCVVYCCCLSARAFDFQQAAFNNDTEGGQLLGLFAPSKSSTKESTPLPVGARSAVQTRSALLNLGVASVNVRVFEISVAGTTYWGSTDKLEDSPSFSPAEQFQLSGYFFITDPFDTQGASGNDVNSFDIGLAVLGGAGSYEVALATAAGALDWASNSGVHGVVKALLGRGYADQTWQTMIDYCTVSQDENGVYTFQMDNSAGYASSPQELDAWNFYTVTSGSFAGAKADKPVAGGVQFVLHEDGTVEGYVELYGTANLVAEPFGGGTSAIAANFQGAEIQP